MNMLGLTALFLAAFIAQHFAMSHPLRAPLIARLGQKGFLGVYSALSLGLFIAAIWSYRQIAPGETYWAITPAIWMLATFLMWLASVLFVGSLVNNPAAPSPDGKMQHRAANGVFVITRHPMMWAFALWSIVHMIIAPRMELFVLCGAILLLALAGAKAQDHKKAVKLGDEWRDWQTRTSFVPFGKGLQSPGLKWLLIGTLFWLVAMWLHPLAGSPPAGIFAY